MVEKHRHKLSSLYMDSLPIISIHLFISMYLDRRPRVDFIHSAHTHTAALPGVRDRERHTNDSQRDSGPKSLVALFQELRLVISTVQSCVDTRIPHSPSGKVGQKHSTACLVLNKNKSDIELTGPSTNVVNLLSSSPAAKPQASRSKSAL